MLFGMKRSGDSLRAYQINGIDVADTWHGTPTYSGETINPETSLGVSAVWRAISAISESLAMSPLEVYRERAFDDESLPEIVPDDPLQFLLTERPNELMTPFEFKQTVLFHLLTWGNSYHFIEFNDIEPAALRTLLPSRITPKTATGGIVYEYNLPGGGTETYTPDQVLHIKGMSPDGLVGFSPIAVHRQNLGLMLGVQHYGAQFFGNNATPSTVLRTQQSLADTVKAQLVKAWNALFDRKGSRHGTALIEGDFEIEQVGLPPEDAQFLQTREFTVAEVARIYGIPPTKLADLQFATYSNVEQEAVDYVNETLKPWATRIEDSLNSKFLGMRLDGYRYFMRWDLTDLLVGDQQSQAETDATLVNAGIITVNEARAKRNLPPLDEPEVLPEGDDDEGEESEDEEESQAFMNGSTA